MRPRLAPIDALLLLMTFIWGSNYSVIRIGLAEIPPLAFNTLRLLLASGLFLAAIAWSRPRRVSRADLLALLGLGLVGHTLYQLLFLGGLSRTSIANASLIIGCSPVTVGLLSVAVGHERVTRWHWAGTALSVLGLYLVVGGRSQAGASPVGDLLTVGAIVCWAVYSVGSRTLLARHTPLVVTGASMTLGTFLYVPFGARELAALDWLGVSAGAWTALVFSAVFGLCVAYLIWYTAVQSIGNARTSVYSNMVPVAAIAVAWAWLGEPIDAQKVAGAAAILGGVGMTRIGRPAAPAHPPEE